MMTIFFDMIVEELKREPGNEDDYDELIRGREREGGETDLNLNSKIYLVMRSRRFEI